MEIAITRANTAGAPTEPGELIFGKTFTDHMFLADYRDGAWHDPRIVPFGDLTLSPAAMALHYGQSVFEGLKAFKRDNGELVLFRPNENHARLNRSAARLAMPPVPAKLWQAALRELILLDGAWTPALADGSLYVRPVLFATEPYLGVRPSDQYTFAVFLSPAGAYYQKPLSVKIETGFSRATPGGTGTAKAAGNYAGSLMPTEQAKAEGFDQLVWTDAATHQFIEESGTMNLCAVVDGRLITPPVNDTILPSITCDSLLQIAADLSIPHERRPINVSELIDWIDAEKLEELFGVGTAVVTIPIHKIGHEDKTYDTSSENKLSTQLRAHLEAIRAGTRADTHRWIVPIQ